MYKAQAYRFPDTVAEAMRVLLKYRPNAIIGGGCWMKQNRKQYRTLVDLSLLGLDQIEEKDGYFEIGAMVTLRDLETSPLLESWLGKVWKDMLVPIVGTQFRNCATVGGTVFSRFGFSDVLTLLMVLDTTVVLGDGRELSLEEFCNGPREKMLITHIRIKKTATKAAYRAFRRTATDLPTLTMAVSCTDGAWKVAVGARPMMAKLCPAAAEALAAGDMTAAKEAVCAMNFGTNMRGTAEYRKHLAGVLLQRACDEMGGAE